MACKEVDTNVEEEEKRAKRRPSLKLKRNGEKENCRHLCSDEDENSNPADSQFEMCDKEALENLSKPFIPKDTQQNTQWAMKNF